MQRAVSIARIGIILVWLCAYAFSSALRADDLDNLQIGVQSDGRIVVPTNQVLTPAGRQITFPGRPVDLAFVDAKTLVVKNMRDLVFVDVEAANIKQTLALP